MKKGTFSGPAGCPREGLPTISICKKTEFVNRIFLPARIAVFSFSIHTLPSFRYRPDRVKGYCPIGKNMLYCPYWSNSAAGGTVFLNLKYSGIAEKWLISLLQLSLMGQAPALPKASAHNQHMQKRIHRRRYMSSLRLCWNRSWWAYFPRSSWIFHIYYLWNFINPFILNHVHFCIHTIFGCSIFYKPRISHLPASRNVFGF